MNLKFYLLVMCHMILFHVSGFSQGIAITGTVLEQSGDLLPGVTVAVKGTNTGSMTDINGKYSVTVPNRDAVLVFSYIGFDTQEIPVGNRTTINVTLNEGTLEMEEVVVVGYGTMRKSDLTGSVTRITMDDKANDANVNLTQALSGVAGINLTQSGGATGAASFTIRGQNTISASQSPLIVVDGIIYWGSLDNLNIDDIETIDVLKDASAAAVYGSRSSNGVLLITTKKGKTAKPVVSVGMFAGFQNMTNNPMRVMDGEEFAIRLLDWDWEKSVYDWYKTMPTSAAGRPVRPDINNRQLVASYLKTFEEQQNYLKGPDQAIDWVDEVLQIGSMQNYNVNVRGSSERTTHFTSVSFSDIKGIQKNDNFKRLTVRNNMETKINDWLTIGLNASYSHRERPGLAASLSSARVASPWVDNKIGQDDYDINLGGEIFQPYPLVNLYVNKKEIFRELLGTGRAIVTLPFLEGFRYELNYSYSHGTQNYDEYHNSRTPTGVSNGGYARKRYWENNSWIVNNIINYVRDFGDHRVNLTLLYSREARDGSSTTAQNQKFENELLLYNNLGQGTMHTVGSSAYDENSLSYMARANYTYKSRYLLTATIRKDGFSGFGADKKFATFPSVGVGWVASEENFMKDLGFYLKTRVSYGQNGNQGVGRYSSLSTMASYNTVFGNTTAIGLYPNALGNADLGWETTTSFNVGFDFGLLKNRITGSIDGYVSTTNDILVRRALPPTSGYASVMANIGQLAGKGFEFSLNTLNIKNSVFKWNSSFNFSLYRDKINWLYGKDVPKEEDQDIGNKWFRGKPISAIYDYKVLGIWTEEEFFAGKCYDKWYPGQFKYADLNGDGAIEPGDDRTVIGYRTPNYSFGIWNNLSYKKLSLTFFINSIQGGKNYFMANNADNISPRFYFSERHNNSSINPYWTPDAPTKNTTGIYNIPERQPSGIYQSRSFVRLQDVTLAYNFSKSLLEKIKFGSAQIYVSSKNPYVWTKWQGWDPEIGGYNWSNSSYIDSPLMRNIVAGLKFSF